MKVRNFEKLLHFSNLLFYRTNLYILYLIFTGINFMEKIRFSHASKNWLFITLLILSIVLILLGVFEIIPFEHPKANKRMMAAGSCINLIFLSRVFWFRNYVEWNKKRILIRIRSFFGKNIGFHEIRNTELENNTLIINKYNGDKVNFNLHFIDPADAQKLKDILDEKSQASRVLS